MINDIQLTTGQQEALNELKNFIEQDEEEVFILKGYAGSGKTLLIRFLADWLIKKNQEGLLMAPTGRAARVLSNKTGYYAATIHSMLYVFSKISRTDAHQAGHEDEEPWNEDVVQLALHFELRAQSKNDQKLIVVDEASMVSHLAEDHLHAARFGTGRLLHDLMHFAKGRKIVFVGDPCQLPPVSSDPFSAALSKSYLIKNFHVRVREFELTQIVRQQPNSEILRLADPIRQGIDNEQFTKWVKLDWPRTEQVVLLNSEQNVIETFVKLFRKHGHHHAIIVNHSNALCSRVNKAIRQQLYPNKQNLQPGDLLMVVQNNITTQLANGDQVEILSLGKKVNYAGFDFIEARVRVLHNNSEYETLLLENLLHKEQPNLSREEFTRLYIDFDRRMRKKNIKRNSPNYLMNLQSDPYLNALKAKFGYGITVHKAQGGEWPVVFVNMNKSIYGMQPEPLYRWLYTALTRAQQQMYLTDGFWIKGFDRRQHRYHLRY